MKNRLFVLVLVLLLPGLLLFAKGKTEDEEEAVEEQTMEKAAPMQEAAVPLKEYPAYWPPTGEMTIVKIGEFKEAPELAAMVKAGELDPVEMRLPVEPLVLKPIEEVGKYGGRRLQPRRSGAPGGQLWRNSLEFLVTYSTPYLDQIYPNVAKDWDASPDGKTYVFYLREGMKWSDGDDFDADDIMFWYNDVILNDELYPSKPANLKTEGELVKVTKLNDYAVEFAFTASNPLFLKEMARFRPPPYVPSHILKNYHPNYVSADVVAKAVKDGGYDTWADFFLAKVTNMRTSVDPELPVVSAWKAVNDPSEQVLKLERNPFYFKVDTEGQQLPYINGIDQPFAETEAWLLMAMAGDVDYARSSYVGGIPNLAVLIQNMDKGDYRITPASWAVNTYSSIFFNFTHEDPAKRQLFNDFRFREAISAGINRDEINDLIFDGFADPSQPRPAYGAPYDNEERYKRFTKPDENRANSLLDEMGLTARDGDGNRLGPDGKPLLLTMVGDASLQQNPEIMELYKDQLAKVGIKIVVKVQDAALINEMLEAGKYDLLCSGIALGATPMNPVTRGSLIPVNNRWTVCPSWASWIVTDGKEGVEPPDYVKRLYEIGAMANVELDDTRRNELVHEANDIIINNLLIVGGINEPQRNKFFVIKNNLRNVHVPGDMTATEDYPTQPSQWFFK